MLIPHICQMTHMYTHKQTDRPALIWIRKKKAGQQNHTSGVNKWLLGAGGEIHYWIHHDADGNNCTYLQKPTNL